MVYSLLFLFLITGFGGPFPKSKLLRSKYMTGRYNMNNLNFDVLYPSGITHSILNIMYYEQFIKLATYLGNGPPNPNNK
jgi:hypothetical protein